jgi:uncharacterized protein YcnI
MLRMRSALVVAAVAAAAVVAQAAAASAHEEINPKTFPTGQPTFFTLTAANEESANLVKIVLHAPAGVAFGSTTRSPTGWSVARTDDTITWTGGAVKPAAFEQWGYEIEGADQPGSLPYKVTLGFADGKTDDVEVDVNAVAPGSTGSPTASTVTTGAAAPAATGTADSEDRGGRLGLRRLGAGQGGHGHRHRRPARGRRRPRRGRPSPSGPGRSRWRGRGRCRPGLVTPYRLRP